MEFSVWKFHICIIKGKFIPKLKHLAFFAKGIVMYIAIINDFKIEASSLEDLIEKLKELKNEKGGEKKYLAS